MPTKKKKMVQIVRCTWLSAQLRLDVGHGSRVEQLAQLFGAEQLSEELPVERERLRAPLCRRRVVLVHVRRDVVEQERGGERRRGRRLDLDDVHLPRGHAPQQLPQAGHVEDVLQALAVRLEHDREGRVAAGDLEERLRLEALLPERRALARSVARDQQGARRVLAEPRAEERALPDLLDDELLDVLGRDQELGERGRRVGVGQVERDAVVRPDRLHLEAEGLAQARGEGERPRRVNPAAEGREDADSPVADLVAEALDHHRPVGGHRPGRGSCSRRNASRLRAASSSSAYSPRSALESLLLRERDELARRGADRRTELDGPPHALAFPERHGSRDAGRRRDEHAVPGDLLDPPGGSTEQEGLTGAGLVDHLLVQLADAAAALDELHRVQAAVRDRAPHS